MNLRIEPLKEEYIDDLYQVELDCFLENPWSKEAFIEELYNPLAVYFLLFYEEELVGYAGLWKILDEGHITNIGVLKSHRKKGFGSILVTELLRFMEEKELSLLTLEVRKSNLPAQNLYQKFGFREIGIRKNYYENKEDAVLYQLERKCLEDEY